MSIETCIKLGGKLKKHGGRKVRILIPGGDEPYKIASIEEEDGVVYLVAEA